MAKTLTTDEWVRRLNKLAAEIDEWCATTHPSGWPHVVGTQMDEWRELAKRPTYDPPTQMAFGFDEGEDDE